MTAKVGDKVIYPGQGLGQVTAIERRDIQGSMLTFYSIRILNSGAKIMAPKGRLKSIGVRPPISKKDAQKVVSILSSSPSQRKTANNWQKRHQAYQDKLKGGSIYEIAEIVRDLSGAQKSGELSYGERRVMDRASGMVFSELALAIGKQGLQKIPLSQNRLS